MRLDRFACAAGDWRWPCDGYSGPGIPRRAAVRRRAVGHRPPIRLRGAGPDSGLGLAEGLQHGGETELTSSVGLIQSVQEEAAEESAEDANGEKESGAAGDPFCVGGQ